MKKRLTAIDLFSGIGGLTEGLKQANFRVLAAVEIDPLAAESYKQNHPGVRVWQEDICGLPAAHVAKAFNLKPGALDLLAGCPPCQGFSKMTTLNGRRRSTDPRNALVFEFLRFVRVLRPKAIMLENVPGLGKKHRQSQLIPPLRSLGYSVVTDVLDAADYGVPQRRKRFILLGVIGDSPPKFARRVRKRITVRKAFEKLGTRAKKDPLHTLPEVRSERIRKLIRRIPKNGGSRVSAGSRYQLECHKKVDGFWDVYGRMAWDDVAPTITGGCFNPSKGRFLHPSKNRNITLREAAILQSFRPSYFISLSRGKCAAAQMIGNALPPEFIRRHALELQKALDKPDAEK
jgi:DNA (cytosine-5)-methyltransferase 1